MVGEGTEPVGRVCLGTVKGDMHDIGKNLVHIMMEGSGIEVFDLGVDTSAEQFVSTAVENHCGVIACSSLLTTTMEEMREVVKLVHERGLQNQIKVMVGGVEGTNLTVVSTATIDGVEIIEAVERQDKTFCLGVQFHPENDCKFVLYTKTPEKALCDYETCLNFFEMLVEYAGK